MQRTDLTAAVTAKIKYGYKFSNINTVKIGIRYILVQFYILITFTVQSKLFRIVSLTVIELTSFIFRYEVENTNSTSRKYKVNRVRVGMCDDSWGDATCVCVCVCCYRYAYNVHNPSSWLLIAGRWTGRVDMFLVVIGLSTIGFYSFSPVFDRVVLSGVNRAVYEYQPDDNTVQAHQGYFLQEYLHVSFLKNPKMNSIIVKCNLQIQTIINE